MTQDEYRRNLEVAYSLAGMLNAVPAQEMVDMLSQAETIAPFLDPTLWMQKGEAAREDKAMLSAIATFQQRVRDLVGDRVEVDHD